MHFNVGEEQRSEKAMNFPSGDHDRLYRLNVNGSVMTSPSACRECNRMRSAPEGRLAMTMSSRASETRRKAIWRPSGDHAGFTLWPGPWVRREGAPPAMRLT